MYVTRADTHSLRLLGLLNGLPDGLALVVVELGLVADADVAGLRVAAATAGGAAQCAAENRLAVGVVDRVGRKVLQRLLQVGVGVLLGEFSVLRAVRDDRLAGCGR